jgi:DNA-binding NarL/FixJ family response regulator
MVNGKPLLQRGLAELLTRQSEFDLVESASLTAESAGLLGGRRPDITILISENEDEDPDVLVNAILKRSPDEKIAVLTDSDDFPLICRIVTSGAHACLVKSVRLDELASVIHVIHRDDDRFILSAPRAALKRLRPVGRTSGLRTNRETEILRLAATGMSNRIISDHPFISEATVKRHLANAYTKLEVTSRANAVRKASELNLLQGGR